MYKHRLFTVYYLLSITHGKWLIEKALKIVNCKLLIAAPKGGACV
jgi:hypothetical protein